MYLISMTLNNLKNQCDLLPKIFHACFFRSHIFWTGSILRTENGPAQEESQQSTNFSK
jgi:hypothetical protein